MRAFEDRTSADSEILFAGVTTVEAALSSRNTFAFVAGRADHAVRPNARFQILPGRFRVGVLAEELEGADCASAHRVTSFDESRIQQGLLFCQEKKRENDK
jgi:hypothetical protein